MVISYPKAREKVEWRTVCRTTMVGNVLAEMLERSHLRLWTERRQ